MRRLNDAELNARIHKFLYRKFSEFPELNVAEERTRTIWQVGAKTAAHQPGVL